MKTEKEFSDFFVESCQHENQQDNQRDYQQKNNYNDLITEIAKNYWLDLTSHLNTYFSNEDRLSITEKAAGMLSENLRSMPTKAVRLEAARPEEAWPMVIRDFLQNNYWGFQKKAKKPEKKKTEEQRIFWKFFKYIWAFVQSTFIIKTAVYFFGVESAWRPNEISIWWMWLFFAISTASLFYFAYRNRHDKD